MGGREGRKVGVVAGQESDKVRQLPGHALRSCFVRARAQEADDVRALSGTQGSFFELSESEVTRIGARLNTQENNKQAY